MELTELTNLCFSAVDAPPPFAIGTVNQTAFIINNRNQCEIVQLQYDTADVDHLKLQLSVCTAPSDRATAIATHAQVRATADPLQRQPHHMLLDATLLPQLVPHSIETVYTVQQLCDSSDSSSNRPQLVAGLTNFGALHVHTHGPFDRRWSQRWTDLSTLWLQHCKADGDLLHTGERISCEQLVTDVRTVQLVAFTWRIRRRSTSAQGVSEHRLVAITAAGRAVFFGIGAEVGAINTNARIVFSSALMKPVHKQHNQVTHVVWEAEDGDDSVGKSYLCTADTMGNIRLYTVDADERTGEITGVQHLVDCMQTNFRCTIGALYMNWLPAGTADTGSAGQLLVVACPANKVLIFHVNSTDPNTPAVATLNVHHMRSQTITGCARIDADQYAVCTHSGLVQLLQLDAEQPAKIVRTVHTVRTPINMERYQLSGLAVSRQQALWLFVLYPRQPFDHLVVRQPLSVSVCTPPMDSVLQRLLDAARQTAPAGADKRISGWHDCAEVLRYRQLRHSSELVFELPTVPTWSARTAVGDPEPMHTLRLRLLTLYCLTGFNLRSFRQNRIDELHDEIAFVQTTLLVMNYYRRLQQMYRPCSGHAGWTDRQRLAARCMRQALAQYCGLACVQRQYDELAASLRDAFIELTVADAEDVDCSADEECNQCDASVSIGAAACSAGHPVDRCCISAMVLPMATAHGCRQCSRVALDGVQELREVVRADATEVFMCPVCDVSLLRL